MVVIAGACLASSCISKDRKTLYLFLLGHPEPGA
ncbi:hypothetical protein PDESU_02639 [Pontiella desulfatans]|uniref:Uncharacterized protein n=1 Tax=Pontiella desulfatans TaxID=2750659 RepID=A0A6C2U278_PONDE|nr:hypothetical protein PDESU_02639 [Pontiella desulfatans]